MSRWQHRIREALSKIFLVSELTKFLQFWSEVDSFGTKRWFQGKSPWWSLNARERLNQAGDTPPNNLCTLSMMKNIGAKLILDILSLKSQGKKLTIFTPLPLTHREERTGCWSIQYTRLGRLFFKKYFSFISGLHCRPLMKQEGSSSTIDPWRRRRRVALMGLRLALVSQLSGQQAISRRDQGSRIGVSEEWGSGHNEY